MKSKPSAQTVIDGYEQANKDAKEMLLYLQHIDNPSQLSEENLPSLVRNLENENSVATQTYISTAAIVGGSVATTVGASLASSAMGGIGMAAVGGIGVLGLGVAFPALIPILAIPLSVKLLSDAKIKKYIKNNENTMKKNKSEMGKERNRLLKWLKDLQARGVELEKEINERINEKYSDFKKKAKKLAKDVSIQIDDCLNADTNKRILQYNEVILNQYKLQKELEEKVEFLFDEYNTLLSEKKELERQINCLIKLLNAMGCPESVINQALN